MENTIKYLLYKLYKIKLYKAKITSKLALERPFYCNIWIVQDQTVKPDDLR